jgi:hypothetical protein
LKGYEAVPTTKPGKVEQANEFSATNHYSTLVNYLHRLFIRRSIWPGF